LSTRRDPLVRDKGEWTEGRGIRTPSRLRSALTSTFLWLVNDDVRTRNVVVVDDHVRSALASSHLRELPPSATTTLLDRGRRRLVPAGGTLHRAGDGERHVELVVRGLVRVNAMAPDGRTLTVRYCRAGALMGVMSLYVDPFVMPATTEALVETDLLTFDPDVLRRLADRDALVARALLLELSERAATFASEIGGSAFSTVRQRVARHLLDLATPHDPGPQLVAVITQDGLAGAVGTAREVVVRTLRELRRDRLVETRRGGITVLEPERLLVEAYADAASGT
jgi:CRP/FNR family transcriptional regulator, cyclic AMP receptor protein